MGLKRQTDISSPRSQTPLIVLSEIETTRRTCCCTLKLRPFNRVEQPDEADEEAEEEAEMAAEEESGERDSPGA